MHPNCPCLNWKVFDFLNLTIINLKFFKNNIFKIRQKLGVHFPLPELKKFFTANSNFCQIQMNFTLDVATALGMVPLRRMT